MHKPIGSKEVISILKNRGKGSHTVLESLNGRLHVTVPRSKELPAGT